MLLTSTNVFLYLMYATGFSFPFLNSGSLCDFNSLSLPKEHSLIVSENKYFCTFLETQVFHSDQIFHKFLALIYFIT